MTDFTMPRASSTIELSRAALKANLRFIRSRIGPEVRLSSVVKGNAYGHGIEVFAPLAEKLGIDHFSVFDSREAERVHAVIGPASRIMIMGHIADAELDWAIAHGIEFWVFDLERLEAARAASERVGRPARIHLEVETGFHRTGFEPTTADEAAIRIAATPERFRVEGVCTHFAGAESISNHSRVTGQIRAYMEAVDRLREAGVTPRYRHAACSAATLAYPETILDLVRVGILQYGFWPTDEIRIRCLASNGKVAESPLRRVIRWQSQVMAVKTVEAGDFIGYGSTYLAGRRTRIATVPIGYAHGYARSLSNQGRVLIRGRRCSVVGIVNMNLIVVDVTHVPRVARDDEVVMIGRQNRLSIPVSSFAELSNQLNYELLSRLPADIPREVVG
jgi:alanine racemase